MSFAGSTVRTILIVDDNVGLARLLRKQLKNEGFQVVSVTNGTDGLAWLASHQPDLVLLDLDLSDRSGQAIVDALCGSTRQIPFIVVASHGGERRAVEIMKRGALDYLMKDATLLELLPAVVDQALDQVERRRKLREAEFALDHLRRHYELILNAVGDGICGLDVEGRITFINPAGLRMVGYRSTEMLGQDITILADRPTDGSANMKERVGSDTTFHGTDQLFWRKDGTSFPIEYTSTPVREGGRQVGSVFVFRDVTRRRVLEDQVRQAQKLEAVGRLAGGIAHDFNNLLTVITGYADLLGLSGLDERRQSMVAAIGEAAERATNLTRQLLAFGQKQALHPQVVNVARFFGRVQPLIQRVLSTNVNFEMNCNPDIPRINADPDMLEQVLITLATRAKDAMADSGELTLNAMEQTLRSSSAERPADLLPGHYVCITVSDSGQSLSQDSLSHVFDPFYPAPETPLGSGIGLATVYGIVVQNGGHIEAANGQKSGTTFHIRFPCAKELTTDRSTIDRNLPVGGHESVLIVEEDAKTRQLAVQVLRDLGYRVFEALRLDDAEQTLRQTDTPIDIVVSDEGPFRDNVHDAIRRTRADRPELPLLLMVGQNGDTLQRNAEIAEGVELLSKPFTPDSLARAVRSMLDHLESAI